MSGIGLGTWLLLGMVVLGIYVLPSVTARFTGSHTMELNETKPWVACGGCHEYIDSELNGSAAATDVMNKHINALKASNYTNLTDSAASLQIQNISTATRADICKLCHQVEQGVGGGHTSVTIRACTDKSCHGFDNSTNWVDKFLAFEAQNVSLKLEESADAHSNWYSKMNAENSGYAAPQPGNQSPNVVRGNQNYTAGFYVCMACHTHVGLYVNITGKPKSFAGNLTYSFSGTNLTSEFNVTMNTTDTGEALITKAAAQKIWE